VHFRRGHWFPGGLGKRCPRPVIRSLAQAGLPACHRLAVADGFSRKTNM